MFRNDSRSTENWGDSELASSPKHNSCLKLYRCYIHHFCYCCTSTHSNIKASFSQSTQCAEALIWKTAWNRHQFFYLLMQLSSSSKQMLVQLALLLCWNRMGIQVVHMHLQNTKGHQLQRIVVGFARKQLQHDLQAFQTPDRPQPYKLAGDFNIVLQYNALSCCMPPDDKWFDVPRVCQ